MFYESAGDCFEASGIYVNGVSFQPQSWRRTWQFECFRDFMIFSAFWPQNFSHQWISKLTQLVFAKHEFERELSIAHIVAAATTMYGLESLSIDPINRVSLFALFCR